MYSWDKKILQIDPINNYCREPWPTFEASILAALASSLFLWSSLNFSLFFLSSRSSSSDCVDITYRLIKHNGDSIIILWLWVLNCLLQASKWNDADIVYCQLHIYTQMHAQSHMFIHAQSRMRSFTHNMHANSHACIQSSTQSHLHLCMNTATHAFIHVYSYTHIHANTQDP